VLNWRFYGLASAAGPPAQTVCSLVPPNLLFHQVYIDDEQMSWFEQQLQGYQDRPVIVFTHAPPQGCGLKVSCAWQTSWWWGIAQETSGDRSIAQVESRTLFKLALHSKNLHIQCTLQHLNRAGIQGQKCGPLVPQITQPPPRTRGPSPATFFLAFAGAAGGSCEKSLRLAESQR